MKFKLILIFLAFFVSSCGEPVSQPKAMLAEKIDCPEGSSTEIERWGGVGENGWLRACKMKHGTFTAWNGEVKAVQGEYINGHKEGLWVFWDRSGNKHKEITYKGGKEVNVQEF